MILSERKSGRPAPLSRRSTPQYVTKVGAGWSTGRTKERESREEESRDSAGESFPQFWYEDPQSLVEDTGQLVKSNVLCGGVAFLNLENGMRGFAGEGRTVWGAFFHG